MSLKYRFLKQSMLILISTIIITGCVGLAYLYIYNLVASSSKSIGLGEPAVIIMKNDNVIYQSHNLSKIQIKEIMMNISISKNEFTVEDITYRLKWESFTSQNNERYNVIRLNPINLDGFYKPQNVFVTVIFLLTFVTACVIVNRQNLKNIINPIIKLKKDTERLRKDELDTAITDEGFDEVKELGKEVEQLRLKLKNSAYYQQKSDENRKFLISSISHDLKTPITSIRGYIDGVLDGVADTEEKKRDYLTKAVDKTKLITVMIEDLLLYSKLDLNQIPFNGEITDIEKYIEDCIQGCLVEFEREGKTISMESSLSKGTCAIIDPDKFKRVVQNIFDNAKKNIEENKGKLSVILRETNSSVIMEFKDNGRGIKEKDLPFVFDRFYRADAARAIEGSSGLGLAIAKQIVEGLDGRIWAVSKPEEGASIIISVKKHRK